MACTGGVLSEGAVFFWGPGFSYNASGECRPNPLRSHRLHSGAKRHSRPQAYSARSVLHRQRRYSRDEVALRNHRLHSGAKRHSRPQAYSARTPDRRSGGSSAPGWHSARPRPSAVLLKRGRPSGKAGAVLNKETIPTEPHHHPR